MINVKNGFNLTLAVAVISGLANFANKFAMQAVGKNSFQYTTLKNIVPALIFTLLIFTPIIFKQLKKISGRDWLKLILIGAVGGGIPFLLFFQGLSMTSAVNASFIHKTLFVWVAILAIPFLKEKITKMQFLALGILLFGNLIFGGLNKFSFGYAEFLVFTATILWAIENIIAKKVLKNISSLAVGWARMFFGIIILFGFLIFTKNTAGIFDLALPQVGWLAMTGILLSGYVFCWYAAIKKLPVSLVACVLVLASPITSLLNSVFITNQFNRNLIGLSFVSLAGVLIFWQNESKFKSDISLKIYVSK